MGINIEELKKELETQDNSGTKNPLLIGVLIGMIILGFKQEAQKE